MNSNHSAKRGKGGLALHPSVYEGIRALHGAEIGVYEQEVCTNMPVKDGIILSPYYIIRIGGEELPVYASRSANGIHSFAYLDVKSGEADGSFSLNVEITPTSLSSVLEDAKPEVVVLPESTGVTAQIEGETVSAAIDGYGSYSFAFNKSHLEPLTLMVKEYEEFSAPEGYTVRNIEPGDHALADTTFTDENTVYYFKAGQHKTDSISLPSNSVLYLERGAYIAVRPSPDDKPENALYACGENIRIEGRGIIDFSACCGGETVPEHANNKFGVAFSGVKGASVRGLSVINAQSWSVCFYDCENVYVSDVFIMGYRVFSDGVMLSDCRNGLVENCFVRTGDDAFETKSTTRSGYTDNILFRNNAAWTDKAVAYGCIFESNQDTKNVRFENNSVGFALGTWSKHLGCNVIQMGDNPAATMHDIAFEGTEIYTSRNQAICNIYIGGSGGRGEGWGNVRDILFRNITAENNRGLVFYVQTYENERSTQIRLMKVKDMMLREAIEERRARSAEAATL